MRYTAHSHRSFCLESPGIRKYPRDSESKVPTAKQLCPRRHTHFSGGTTMKLLLSFAVAVVAHIDLDQPASSQELADRINSKQSSW
eukprot:1365813-Amorphochlora_amoeboformis.AAC.2